MRILLIFVSLLTAPSAFAHSTTGGYGDPSSYEIPAAPEYRYSVESVISQAVSRSTEILYYVLVVDIETGQRLSIWVSEKQIVEIHGQRMIREELRLQDL